jgi:biofilm PGA synthesis N-glycosyltransferase PgaC
MTETEYVIISPIRNEERHIEKTLESVVSQTTKPKKWLIVDDGSTDRTADIIKRFIKHASRYNDGHNFIELIKRLQQADEVATLDRIAKAAPPRTFNFGLKHLYETIDGFDYDFIVKLDGDLSFDPDYFKRLIENFRFNPRLGIASGISSFPQGDKFWTPSVPGEHVLGCSKMYRKECFADIGGLVEVLGWDTIDEIKAQMLGWQTRHFKDVPLIHWRMMGSRTGFVRGKIRHGFTNYYLGYHPLYMLARVLRRTTDRPYGISGVLLGMGYLKGWLTKADRFPDENFRRYLRDTQLKQVGKIWRRAG